MNTRANAERSDAAMELEHLQALVCEIGSLAQRSLAERGEVVTLAWLRGIVYWVEHLETSWRSTVPSGFRGDEGQTGLNRRIAVRPGRSNR
jgi:hypothetical protein